MTFDLLALRVAARYLAASAWAAPPALVRDVGKWVASVYAGHVLALVEASLERARAPAQAGQAIAMLASYRQDGEARIRALKPKKTLRFKNPNADGDDFIVAHEFTAPGVSEEGWRHGTGKSSRIDWWAVKPTPDEPLEWFLRWLSREEEKAQTHKQRLENPYGPYHPSSKTHLVELHLLRQECLKYTGSAKARANKVESKFTVDVSGWKYLTPEEHAKAPEFIEDKFGHITVIIYFRAQHRNWAGLWHGSSRTMSLDAPAGDRKSSPSIEIFRDRMQNLLETVRHECQHVGQDLLRMLRGLKQDAGLPPLEMRQPGRTPEGLLTPELLHERFQHPSRRKKLGPDRIEHHLRDVEFFTNLEDDKAYLLREIRKRRPADRPAFFKQWVGLGPPPASKMVERLRPHSERLWKLRKDAPAKWDKAVKELWKAVEDELS